MTKFFSMITHRWAMRGERRSIQLRMTARTAGVGRTTVEKSRTSMNVGHSQPSSYSRASMRSMLSTDCTGTSR